MKTKQSIQELIYTGMLTAVAGALISLEFFVPIMPPFYKIGFSDALSIATLFLMEPVSAVQVEIIRIIIRLITVDTDSVYVGEFTNLIGVTLFVIPMWVVYKKGGKAHRAAIASLAVSILVRTLPVCFCDASIILPLYITAMGLSLNQVITVMAAVNPAVSDLITLIFLAIIPFSLIKFGLNCSVEYLLYTGLLTVYPTVRTV